MANEIQLSIPGVTGAVGLYCRTNQGIVLGNPIPLAEVAGAGGLYVGSMSGAVGHYAFLFYDSTDNKIAIGPISLYWDGVALGPDKANYTLSPAGITAIKNAADPYEGAIWVHGISGIDAAVFGVHGTKANPCRTWANVQALLTASGYDHVRVLANVNVNTAPIKIRFSAGAGNAITLTIAATANVCEFENLTLVVTGQISNSRIESCNISSLSTGVFGNNVYRHVTIAAGINLAGSEVFEDCYFAPSLLGDINGGSAFISAIRCSGQIRLATIGVAIVADGSGQLILRGTVDAESFAVVVGGVWEIQNDSDAAADYFGPTFATNTIVNEARDAILDRGNLAWVTADISGLLKTNDYTAPLTATATGAAVTDALTAYPVAKPSDVQVTVEPEITVDGGFTSGDRANLTAAKTAAEAVADGRHAIDYTTSTATQYNADGSERTVFDLLDSDGNPATTAATAVERVPQ